MAYSDLVVRFVLQGARATNSDVFVTGAGLFRQGVLDVPVNDTEAVDAVRAAVAGMATEIGVVDPIVTPPFIYVSYDPYPQYLRVSDFIMMLGMNSELRAALESVFVPRDTTVEVPSDSTPVVASNGDGSFTTLTNNVGDNNDGTFFLPGYLVTNHGDGTYTVAS